MKKILMLALLAISATLSFGETPFFIYINHNETLGECDYGLDVILQRGYTYYDESKGKNVVTTDDYVDGYKIYYYFSSDNGADPTSVFKKYKKDSRAQLEKINKSVYRVVLDYSDDVIKAGTENKKDLSGAFKLVHSGKQCFEPYRITNPDNAHYYKGIVIENKEGKVVYGEHPTYNTKVGVLTDKYGLCPNYVKGALRRSSITMDTENKNNRTRFVEGGDHAIGFEIDDEKNATIYYCPIDYEKMTKVGYDYAVLKLDDKCPKGSYEIIRRHDTEDGGDKNSSSGFVYPNAVNSNITLHFCFVPKTSETPCPLDPIGGGFGVFANPDDLTYLYHSEIYIDDQDGDDNNNKWTWSGLKTTYVDYTSRAKKIMSGSDNTTYHVVHVNQSSLSKSAVVASEASAEISTPVVANSTLANIESVNRESVGFEIQAAGNVEVTLMGVNGRVFAKASAQNLEMGVHSLSWNAANVPSGHYIVTIKHNGAFTGKNVLLK